MTRKKIGRRRQDWKNYVHCEADQEKGEEFCGRWNTSPNAGWNFECDWKKPRLDGWCNEKYDIETAGLLFMKHRVCRFQIAKSLSDTLPGEELIPLQKEG